jgi:hypothetical protein
MSDALSPLMAVEPFGTFKDFGELVFRLNRVAAGVILVRLEGLLPETKATIVA